MHCAYGSDHPLVMEPCLGLRLVRGPDWCWEDQDGGEGSVGTLVEVGEGGRFALVQWDGGTRGRYRCGEDGKFELRVLDIAPTGLQFPDIICSGCYVEGVAGIHWQCAHCYEYQLCHSCYLLGRHCQEHPFFRVESKQQTTRSIVSCRAGAKRVEAKGVFVGAEVVRGPNWRFGDQDGGAGKTGRVVAIEGYKTLTARSIAAVKWGSVGLANIYRVGHKGKVDICCTVAGGDGHYYPEHLAVLGCGASVTNFDEDEIVSGDLVRVELDPELFKMMHESVGLWTSTTSELCGTNLLVLSVLEQGRLRCNPQSLQSRTICYDAVVKLKHCRVGQTVRIISDLAVLHKLQNDNNIWHDDMILTAGQIGQVIKCYANITLQVYVQGRGWLFNPLCLEPAPGETAPYTPDPLNECRWRSNSTPRELREEMERVFTNKALLKGDLTALESFLYSNQIQDDVKAMIFNYYIITGMTDALRLVLKCDGIGPLVKTGRNIVECISHHNKEALAAMLDAGTNVNSYVDEQVHTTPLFWVVRYGNFDSVRMLAVSPGVKLDIKRSTDGITAIRAATAISDHKKVAALLVAGANPTDESKTSLSALHDAVYGKMAVTEAFVVHAKKYLNCLSDQGAAPLHLAVFNNQPRICSLLAAQASVDLNIKWRGVLYTPLHVAVTQSYWSVVECLVGWGAALDPIGNDGDTALHMAINVKTAVRPTSPTLKRVHKELSLIAGGKEVKGYIAVVCFLVHEGADWHIKSSKGVSPHQALPSAVAALIAKYLRSHPGQGTFHGSLRREQQQRRMQELPLQLDLSLHSPPGSATSAAEASATATDYIDRKTRDHKAKDYADFDRGGTDLNKTGFSTKLMSEKYTDAPKPASEEPPVVTSQQTPTSAAKLSTSDPTTQLPPGASQPGGASRQACLLCEEHPAIIRFSPCGHTVLCSRCAERAKKCPQCKAFVESKIIETDL